MFYYGMIGIETGLMIESAGLPIIILSTFNSSFFPTIQLINVPEILTLVILMSASPLTIVFSTLIV
jgi:hypothetical protein